MSYASLWFSPKEFACHDGTAVPEDYLGTNLAALASQLDIIREGWGARVEVVSGYRTATYNALIHGAEHSQHVYARAADVRPLITRSGHKVPWEFLRLDERTKLAEEFYGVIKHLMMIGSLPLVGGLGWYAGKWVHVDVRPKPADGHVAKWEGMGIGSEA